MTRTMNQSNSMSLIHSMKLIYTEGGILGFWKGWQISFLRLTPVLLTYSVTYEQLRLYLGLGYFTSTD
jgi:Mitochondrial carrier protein